MEPDLAARKRLGAEVRQARRRAGLSKTPEWADKVGRSDRVLLGLERGESVGADTYAAVADALDWPLDRLYSILAGEPVSESVASSAELATASHEELVAEVLRRLKAGEHGGDTAATIAGAQGAGAARPRTRRQLEQMLARARAAGAENVGDLERLLQALDTEESGRRHA